MLLLAKRLMMVLVAMTDVSCSSLLDVHAVRAPGVHLEQFATFEQSEAEATVEGYESSPSSPEVERRARAVVTRVLESKGYAATRDAELVVRVAAGRRARAIPRPLTIPHPAPTRPAWFIENETIDEGALVIDAYVRSSGELVWHGAARAKIDPDHIDGALVDRSVTAVLGAFPSRVAASK